MNDLRVCSSTFERMVLSASCILWLAPIHAFALDATVTFTVNTTADQVDDNTSDGLCHTSANTCSLRAAVMQANHLSTSGEVEINVPPGIYRLTLAPSGSDDETSGDLNFTTPPNSSRRISILGTNPSITVIDANHTDRAISVGAGGNAGIAKLMVRNGNNSSVGGVGGGIENEGSLTITDCIIENNYSSTAGGGVGNLPQGSLVIQDSAIRSNATAYSGGGLYLAGNFFIRYSSISSNVATGHGGGAFVSGNGNAKFFATTINSNGANYGGGIETYFELLHPEQIPEATLVNSTLSGNFAYTDGGGINNLSRTFIYNTSIIDNDADHDRDMIGGIGGGVNTASGLRFIAVNSLIARNTVLDAPIYNDCSGTLEVYGGNYFYDVTGCAFSGNGTAARGFVTLDSIGPLQSNGGPTLTHALLSGSAAINGTTAQGCVDDAGDALVLDQRDAIRGTGVACDAGAYEFGATVPVVDRIFANGFELVP